MKITESGWSSITVSDNLCNSITTELVISNSNCLQYIYVKTNSLRNIISLTVSNNPSLSSIVTEMYALRYVDYLTFSSLLSFILLITSIFLLFKLLK